MPTVIVVGAAALMLAHGPIAQPPEYHAFADGRALLGLPNAADVLSNLGFALVGLWGLASLLPARRHPAIAAGWPGYCLFLAALMLTALGSGYYHLAPDNGRLVWDRLPIALACAGILAAVRVETRPGLGMHRWLSLLALAALLGVFWWWWTDRRGEGDLRPYLLLQAAPLVLVPLWQWIENAPRADRRAFACAIALYVAARLAELGDRAVMEALSAVSGHTLKHLLATAAAWVVTLRLVRR
ncbi:MAG: hypothetical protein L6R19_19765, partial [Alphaproteobacteria bacterium]|nr:hypothetical protein [Alphaproteobacteria bacterium]